MVDRVIIASDPVEADCRVDLAKEGILHPSEEPISLVLAPAAVDDSWSVAPERVLLVIEVPVVGRLVASEGVRHQH